MDGLVDDLLGDDAGPLDHLLAGAAGPPPRRRWLVLALVGAVLLTALGAAGWVGAGWLRDGDSRSALARAAQVVGRLVEDVEAAEGPRDLVAVAASLDGAQQRLEQARARALRRRDPGRERVAAELRAQAAVVDALRPLDGTGTGPLQAWGRVRGPLADALQQEALARAALAADRPAAASRLAVLDRLAPALDAVAGPLLARAADAEVARVEEVLLAATTTADVRAAGEVARRQAPALRRSVAVAPDDSSARAMQRCAAMVAAVAGLDAVSGEDPVPWTVARARLAQAVGWPDVLVRVDDVVRRAALAQEQHRVAVAAAEAARAADLTALQAYTASVRGLASPYRSLDARLADPAGQAPALLADDVAVRERLLAALQALVAPPDLAVEHADLLAAAGAEVAAVRALVTAPPSGALADARTAATGARVTALSAWDAAAVRAAALVAVRALPEPPAL